MGDGFSNPVVGGVGTLVRAFIRSVNYVAGAAGWAIFRNGDAEFNAGTFRGTISIGNPPTSGLTIGPTVPAELQTFYGAAPFQIDLFSPSCIIMYANANSYHYEIVGFSTVLGRPLHAVGMVDLTRATVNDQVMEISHEFFIPGSVGSSLIPGLWYKNSALVNAQVGDPNGIVQMVQTWFNTTAQFGVNGKGDLKFNAISIGRGYTAFEAITGVFVSDGTANEQTAFTTANLYTFPNGRAFLVEFVSRMHAAVVNRVGYSIRKTNLAGTKLIGWPTIIIDVTATEIPIYVQGVFVNTSGADVTARLAVTLDPVTANVVDLDGAAAPVPSYIRVTDIGDTSKFTGVSV